MSQNPDVKRAFEALRAKQGPYATLWRYYDGDHPVQYATRQLAGVFSNLNAKWSENWCAVVVDSLLERLTLEGFSMADTSAAADVEQLWAAENADLDAERIHKAVSVCGESYLIVEEDEAGAVHVCANRPHLVHLFYREDAPKTPDFAAKWWTAGKHTNLTLYYRDRIEHWAASATRSDISSPNAFTPDPETPEEPNPWGRLPVFHFCPDPERVLGELTNVIGPQNAINKLLADMMVAAEFGAFKQRYIVSNADTARLVNAPNEVWEIPAADKDDEPTKVGAFDATELSNFIGAMDNLATKIAIITRTPKHYLLQSGDVSGEALLAMEAPLAKKAAKYQARLTTTWCDAVAFVAGLLGHAVMPQDIEAVWADERTIQPYTEALTRKTNVDAGVPLVTQLRMEGWSEAELEHLAADLADEETRGASIADAAMDEARRRFDRGDGTTPYLSGAPA